MKIQILVYLAFLSASALATPIEKEQQTTVDIDSFLTISMRASLERQSRLISIDEFNKMSGEDNTIILDARSDAAYRDTHIKGAINLDFSDFTAKKLAEVIPNKDTRILIYCNNNFISDRASLLDKAPPLALNIPTFINLFGYGYENVYELNDRIQDIDSRVELIINSQ